MQKHIQYVLLSLLMMCPTLHAMEPSSTDTTKKVIISKEDITGMKDIILAYNGQELEIKHGNGDRSNSIKPYIRNFQQKPSIDTFKKLLTTRAIRFDVRKNNRDEYLIDVQHRLCGGCGSDWFYKSVHGDEPDTTPRPPSYTIQSSSSGNASGAKNKPAQK